METTLAIVQVLSNDFVQTDASCIDGPCITFYSQYEAKVLEVLSGAVSEEVVRFSNAQNAQYNEALLENWLVLLERAGTDSPEYQVIDHSLNPNKRSIQHLMQRQQDYEAQKRQQLPPN
ncbi:MAG: hypothetical protein NXI26_27435 [bacterium]|nr:hypothetical protein [bacterium]